MAPRRKAASINAPQNLKDAITAIAKYLALNADIDATTAEADDAIRAIEAARDEQIKPVEAQLKALFTEIRTWWTVARDELTEGKRKSIELAGALLGDRTTTPALKLPKGVTADELTAQLIAEGAVDYIITTQKPDKNALIRLLRSQLEDDDEADPDRLRDQRMARDKLKLTVGQREEFFIDRAKAAEVDPVIQPEAEVVS